MPAPALPIARLKGTLSFSFPSFAFGCLITLWMLSGPDAYAQDTPDGKPATNPTVPSDSSGVDASVKPGINARFLDAELDVSEWLGRFEIESREVYSARESVLHRCQIKPGMRIADVGAGTGFYSRLFAQTVGESGWVYSVDISPKFLDHINTQCQADGIENLTCVLGTARSIRLAPESVDLVFICDTYHHFEFPQQTLRSIHQALKPGGTLVLIDFDRIPGKSREFILGHVRANKETFRDEITAAGFRFVEQVDIPSFEENYFLRFRKN